MKTINNCPFCGSANIKPLRGGWLRCRKCSLGFPGETKKEENLSVGPVYSKAVWKDSLASLHNLTLRFFGDNFVIGGKLLDIGCGHGTFVKAALDEGWRAEGLEISPEPARYAREDLKCAIYEKTLGELKLPENSYEIITLWRVLDQLPDPKNELNEIMRILKPGGMLWMRLNNFSFHNFATILNGAPLFRRLGVRPGVIHKYGVTPKAVRALLLSLGYTDVTVSNSRLTAGNPYSSGGKLRFIVSSVKALAYAFWSSLEFLSGGRLIIGSSMVVHARKPDPRIKIVQVITRLDHGGSTETAVSICNSFNPEKYRLTLMYGLTKDNICPITSQCVHIGVLRRNISLLYDLLALIAIYMAFKRIKPDIVHTHSSKAGFIGRWAAWLARVPIIIYTPHGHIFYGYEFGPLRTWMFILLERLTAPITTVFTGLTTGEMNETIERGIGKKEQWRIIHSGVDVDIKATLPRSAVRAALGLDDDTIVVGVVARLEPVKGVSYLVHAIPHILKATQAKVKFLVAGDGSSRAVINDFISKYDISGSVLMLGHRTDIPNLMNAMDIYVQPSLNEGMGKTIVQAASAKLPIVATNVQGIPDVVIEGKNGFLVPAGNAKKLADGIVKLISDAALRKTMGEYGYQYVRENVQGHPRFSVERMDALLHELYRDMANKL